MRSQESNYMYSSFTKSTIKNQNTQLTEKSVGITIRMFPDYPIEKSQYPINKKISGYYPIHQNFLSGALVCILIRLLLRSSLIRIYTVCHFVYIFWRHYSIVRSNCFILRTTMVVSPGVPIFKVFYFNFKVA